MEMPMASPSRMTSCPADRQKAVTTKQIFIWGVITLGGRTGLIDVDHPRMVLYGIGAAHDFLL